MKHAFVDHHSGIDSPIHRLDARVKIVVLFAVVLLEVSAPPQAFLLFGVFGGGLVGLALLARLPVGHLAKKALVVLPFLVLVTISVPFMEGSGTGGGYSLGIGRLTVSPRGLWIVWNVLVKSFLGVFAIILLYSTTPFPQLIKGLESLHCPRIFTVLLSFMYRYSFILIDEIYRMKRGRDARGFGGRWLWQAKTIGHMVGSLFLRSFHRGEKVYLAMLSRGYEGTMPGVSLGGLGLREMAFLALLPGLLLLRILLG